ncbi:hypothetical protein NC651_011167 [Populus alba x Populus x berolinensis]|nr:hypothetical protein NC651_011167 [Populus alba x Populus x berolinensis]
MSKTSLPFSLCRVLHFSSHSTNLASQLWKKRTNFSATRFFFLKPVI